MLLTEEQIRVLDRLQEELDLGNTSELSDWEQDFLEDNLDRYDTYGERTRLSESQWDHLQQIAEKLGVA